MGNYDLLISKLDEFIRKYYKNLLIKGCAITLTAITGAWIVFTGAEYFGHFSTITRTILFWTFSVAAIYALWKLILVPAAGLMRAGKIISHEQAAAIIGTHFSNVSDKLLNTLQLKAEADRGGVENTLLLASIEQKTQELKPIPFTAAIDFRKNSKYFRYAMIPLAAIIIILFAAPSLLLDGSMRLMKHNTQFESPAPFRFIINNDSLTAIEGEDFTLHVETEGSVLPNEIYIDAEGKQFRLDKTGKIKFQYVFKNIRKSNSFHLLADGYNSGEYELKVIPNPTVLDFNITLSYPSYVGRKTEKILNTGDLNIPAGTIVKWQFRTRNTDGMSIAFKDSVHRLMSDGSNYSAIKTFLNSESYQVIPINSYMTSRDPLSYSVNVVPDLNPSIRVEQQEDSTSATLHYFRGDIRDDYGLSKLTFNYHFIKSTSENPRPKNLFTTAINFNRNSVQDVFFHAWDMQSLMIEPGEEIEYYFEVWDNDGIHGPKSARSQSAIFKAPSLEELTEQAKQNADKTKSDLEKTLQKTKNLQKDLNKAAKDLIDKKSLNYDDKKKIEDLLKQHKELEKQVEEIRKQNAQNNNRENEFKRNNDELKEKKSQLEDLFNKLMSDEMKQLMKELEKMLSEINKDQLKEKLDQMKLDSKDLEKQLDRTLELFKQLEVEQKMKQNLEKLDQLSKEQKELAQKTSDSKEITPEMKEKQQELNKQFEELKKEMKETEKKNEELEFPQELGNHDQETNEISEEMQKSDQQMSGDKKNQKQASQSQKNAAEKMDKLSEKMKQQQDMAQQEQAEEDMKSLRMLLENLIRFSLDQEGLMQEFKSMDVNNPRYQKLAQRQRELKDDSKVIEDSLFALSKRVPQISSTVNTEISSINYNLDKSIQNLQDHLVPQARSDQQYIMTSVNNLALILSEAFNTMQKEQESKQKKPGNGNCKKPGKGKPSPSAEKLRQMQQQLNEQMKAMKQKMEGKQQGKTGKNGQGGMSEELARMAAQQEALRNELQQLSNQENKDGKGSLGNLDQMAKQMEETEKDLVNRRITEETLRRQEEIMTRLLESEKAEREREQDEKRRSTEGKDNLQRNTGQFEEYKKLKMKEVELLKTIPPGMNPFYKNLVNYYFQTLEN